MILLEEKVVREDMEISILEVGGNPIMEMMDMMKRHVGSHGRISKKSEIKRKKNVKSPKATHFVVVHHNICIDEDFLKTPFAC